jgi:hypothetical protein
LLSTLLGLSIGRGAVRRTQSLRGLRIRVQPNASPRASAREVLARSQPDVVAALEPEVVAFEAARIDSPRGDDEWIAAIEASEQLIDDFAEACGQQILRSMDRVR